MRAALLAAAMACGLATGASAATYTLVNPVYNQVALDAGVALRPFAPVDITVSDAAVASGAFSVRIQGSPASGPISETGDVASFVSFHGRELVTPTSIFGTLTASLSFAADGSVTSGSVYFLGVGDELHFSGTSASFGGAFGSDQYNGCSAGCRLTGQLAATLTSNPVPEPVSMGLLGIGVLGALFARRRV